MKIIVLILLFTTGYSYDFTPSPLYFDGVVIKQVNGQSVIGIIGINQELYCSVIMRLGFTSPLIWTGDGSGSTADGQYLNIAGTTSDNMGRRLLLAARFKDRNEILYLKYKIIERDGTESKEVIVIDQITNSIIQ